MVYRMSTPFGVFSKVTSYGVMRHMDIQDLRRKQLQSLVDRDGLSNVSRRLGKPERQINDMLKKRKSFGEKIARSLEKNSNPKLPNKWFDDDDEIDIYKSIGRTKETLSIADSARVREFLELTPEQQTKVLQMAKEDKSGRSKESREGK